MRAIAESTPGGGSAPPLAAAPGTVAARRWPLSLRGQLLGGILLPMLVLVAINAVSLYRQALAAADTAYDRTLLASAKSIGELLEVTGSGEQARLKANVLYAALEPFEADVRSRMFYKVTGFQGEITSGYADLPRWRGTLPARGPYAALVDFYNDEFRGQQVRVAVLLQPVAGVDGQGIATIQVAETLELRETLAREMLVATLWRQAALLALIAIVVVAVVQRATRPVRELSERLDARDENDLSPIAAPDAPRELRPLVDSTNRVMQRLADLLEHQKRFVRDTAHQLRTPLAVLKTQVQSALRGDVAPTQALHEINHTVARATELANQMLSLAKVEQLRQQGDAPVLDWAPIVREVAIDLSALIAERRLDFSLDTTPARVRAHEWALRELTRNLLHNAIRHTPPDSRLALTLHATDGRATLLVADSGAGISPAQQQRLFQPFAGSGAEGSRPVDSSGGGDGSQGSGLGLAICHEIVMALGGQITLGNRRVQQAVAGLDARVSLPLNDNAG